LTRQKSTADPDQKHQDIVFVDFGFTMSKNGSDFPPESPEK